LIILFVIYIILLIINIVINDRYILHCINNLYSELINMS